MHKLESSIAEWRRSMRGAPHLAPEALNELESHLRDAVRQFVSSGMSEEEAFGKAVAQMGTREAVTGEFAKLRSWSWRPTQIVTGMGVLLALSLLCQVAHLLPGRKDFLLTVHTITLSLGYEAVLLLGLWGICVVGRRCRAPFSEGQLHALSRVSYTYLRVAAILVSVGIFLGMLWSKREWNRYWGWDPKEIGALTVLVWLAVSLWAHLSRQISRHVLLVSSLLGSTILILAWIVPNQILSLHGYRGDSFSVSMAFILANLFFGFLGLAPGGWLRMRKA